MRADLVKVQATAETSAQEVHRVAERTAKADSERDTARHEASTAREEAAKLSGQIEAMQHQVTELVRVLGGRNASASSNGSQAT
jgi:predicted  nucleic acid-binding Zn-ribbon protein